MRNQKLEITNENEQFKKNNIVKDANIKELIEEPKEIKSPNWLDKNKFKEILTIIDSNKFGHKNKIGDFKYSDIKDLVNNIRNNTISKIDAKKDLNTLNKIKNPGIMKYRQRTTVHKEFSTILYIFNDLSDTILTDKTLESESQEDKNENENDETLMPSKDDANENDKTLMSSNEDNENEDDDDETMSKNEKSEIIKGRNDILDEIIDKPKSFEEQIKLLKKKRRSKRILAL